ncbi:hypothetical protein ABZ840_15480 [Streptomyces sp. NPDC047117]|uniref:hypothetical protein n=1 Tax=unclassified Streptomyces TaxID=2593676 RepID=UPI0033FB459E
MTSDATRAPRPDGAAEPAPGPAAQPEPTPPPAGGGRFSRLRRRFAALGAANKIATVGLVIAAVPVLTPLVTAGYDALFGEEAVAMDVSQADDSCSARYVVPPDQERLRSSVPAAPVRTLTRWEREKKITHLSEVEAAISIRGNLDKAVQIRDLTLTITRRAEPTAGRVAPHVVCGGNGIQEVFAVDLDTLPVGRPVSSGYLLTSPHQEAARQTEKQADRHGLRLPKSIGTSDVYDLLITGRTRSHYTEWRATLTWWDGETLHRTTIDNDGRPFRVTAAPRPVAEGR